MDYEDYRRGVARDFFWFRAKEKLIGVLLNKLNCKKKLKILNVGAGTGNDLSVLRKFGKIYAVDTNKNALDLLPKDLVFEKLVCDACQMPYPDGFFDLVVAFDVLEHIKEDSMAVNEINRVLKPNGFFVFTVPAFNFLYSSHDRALNHFRRYNNAYIKKLLTGFSSIEQGYWMFFLFLPVALQRLIRRRDHKPKIHYVKLPKVINNLLYSFLSIENWLIAHNVTLPLGTTIYGIYKNQEKQ